MGEEHDDPFVLQLRAALTTQMMVMCLRVNMIMKFSGFFFDRAMREELSITRYIFRVAKYHKRSFQHLTILFMST